MYPRPSLSSSTSDAPIPGPSSALPPNIDYQNPTELPRITIEHYTGCAPPPNSFYYPPYIAKDFEQLLQNELDEREQSGLNSLPESRGPLVLQRVSSWRDILRAAINGSPKQKLTLGGIRHVLYARFPDLAIGSDNVIRHTLSAYPDFEVEERYWTTVESQDSITQKEQTNKAGKQIGRPPNAHRNVPWATGITVFPVIKTGNTRNARSTSDDGTTGHTSVQLPGCKDLLMITEILSTPTGAHENRYPDVFGCRRLTEMINEQRTLDLKTLARRFELENS